MTEKISKIKIGGLTLKYFIPFFLILLIATYTGTLNNDVIGPIAFLYLFGALFMYVGGIIPIFGSYMGGAVLLPLFGGSALVYFGLVPKTLQSNISGVMSSGAVNVFIAAIVVGSILSMDRKMLLSVTARLLPCILFSLLIAVIFMYIGCIVTGKSILDGIFMVGLPNYTGGSSGALVIVPTIYADFFKKATGDYAGKFIVFMNISNLICVLFAGVLNKLGNKYPKLTGNGVLMRGGSASAKVEDKETHTMDKHLKMLGTGLIVSIVFLILGNILQTLVPQLNFIAWAAVLVIIVKALGILDENICRSSEYWQKFMLGNFLPFLITGVGIASLDLKQLVSYFTLSNFLIIFLGVLGAVVGSLLSGMVFHFYPIDSMIAIGANMGTVGGSGAVATLSTAKRMDLMPFAIISNRIGGALVVVLISLLLPFFV
ncbi:2-hydroxycarboxylate transporter family protein [Companilactobacillus insicii]|uniref:2-hydroxycarboxylate transporter family protein n=1 Tax=Companilactobacillus insicii TaxID=1732567 RepID=UPI000F792C1C|nr:2-hydroxycarboxylate transporter family protein [Companilactobacillus insicii]